MNALTSHNIFGPSSSPAPMSAIEIINVTKRFGEGKNAVVALEAVDLSIASGEFVSIVGPSGCGKSTLLYMLGGFEEPSFGQLFVNGEGVKGPGVERGIVFQEYALFPWLTVRKNIAFGLEQQGVPRAERDEIVQQQIDLIGLRGFEQRYPRELSGGMKQRVAIARTLACRPAIVLLDEPFGALDAQTREVMQDELLRVWRSSRTTVLMVTHDVNEAVYLSQRVCVMSRRPGRIVAEYATRLDHELPREAVMLSSAFNDVRNDVWLATRGQSAPIADG
jgi:NitT/TauT family transport system ATP-binding protein